MAPQLRVLATDDETGLEAFVVVDSLVGGRAMGGTRMTETVTVDEVAGLARKMTAKLALADLPIGGAKAGIVCGLPPGEDRDRRLAEFGRAVAPVLAGGIYLGSDQGVSHRDRDVFLDAAGYDVCAEHGLHHLGCTWAELWERCEDVTGFGVCEGADAGMDGLGLRSDCRTVAIQGFGAVGRAVAVGLEKRGYTVVAVADRYGTLAAPSGLPVGELLAITDPLGTIARDRLPTGVMTVPGAEAWLDVDADVLVLAAGGDAIRLDNVDRVRTWLVVEGANLAVTKEAAAVLATRGVPVLPDIVVNVGGAAVTALMLTGSAPIDAGLSRLVSWLYEDIARRIRTNVGTLIQRAEQDRRPLSHLADVLAAEKLGARDFHAA